MPLVHCIDQHVTPGVMHFSASSSVHEREDPNGYQRRFRATWNITGFNVRTRGVDIDPDDASVKRLRAAQTAIFVSLAAAKGPKEDCTVSPGGVVLYSTVDLSVVAGGIGDIEKVKVTTNVEENAIDGLTVGSFSKAYSWNLIACFDSTLSNIHLAHMPTARGRGGQEAADHADGTRQGGASGHGAGHEHGAALSERRAAGVRHGKAHTGQGRRRALAVGAERIEDRQAALLVAAPADDPAPVITTELAFDELPTDGLEWASEAPRPRARSTATRSCSRRSPTRAPTAQRPAVPPLAQCTTSCARCRRCSASAS